MTLLEALLAIFLIVAIVYMLVALVRSAPPAALGTPWSIVIMVLLVLAALWILRVPLGFAR